jgi:hypothetical protein
MKQIALLASTLAWLAACDAPSAPTSNRTDGESGPRLTELAGTSTPVTGLVYNCEVLDPGVTTVSPNGVIHIRGFSGRSLLVVGNPLLDGKLIGSDINITIDPNKGTTDVRGKLTFYPDAVPDGTWRSLTVFHVGPEGVEANEWKNGRGTGSLQGMRFELEATPLAESTPNPCNPNDPSAAAVSGVIFSQSAGDVDD